MNLRTVKKDAKDILRGKYANAIGFMLIIFLISFIIPTETLLKDYVILTSILTTIIGAFLSIAQAKYFKTLGTTKERVAYLECKPEIKTSFRFLLANLINSIITVLITLFISMLIALPVVLSIMHASIPSIILSVVIFLIIIFAISLLLTPATTFLTYICLEENPIAIWDSFVLAWSLTFKNFKELAKLIISFIPLILLIVITLGIAALWVIPYIELSLYLAYEKLTKPTDNLEFIK